MSVCIDHPFFCSCVLQRNMIHLKIGFLVAIRLFSSRSRMRSKCTCTSESKQSDTCTSCMPACHWCSYQFFCLLRSTMNRCYDNMESIGFVQWKENKKWKNLPRTTWLFEDLCLQLSHFPSHEVVVSRGSYVIEYIEIYLYRGGHGYCGIELFFKWYFGNLDFNVRYCRII